MMVAAAATQGALGAAVQGAVPNLVAEDDLGRANSLLGVFKSAGFMLGPGIGGMLLAVISPAGVFVVSGVIMLAASALMIGVHERLQSHNRDESVGGRLDGYRQLMADRYMRRLTVAWALVMVGIGPVIVAEVTLANQFKVGSLGYGLIAVAWDGGGVIGALLAGRYVLRRFEQPAVVVGSVAIAGGFAVVGLAPVFWPVLVGMMLAGLFDSLGTVAAQNIIQRRTPNMIQSRVSAALDAVVLGAMAASFALGAPLIAAVRRAGHIPRGGRRSRWSARSSCCRRCATCPSRSTSPTARRRGGPRLPRVRVPHAAAPGRRSSRRSRWVGGGRCGGARGTARAGARGGAAAASLGDHREQQHADHARADQRRGGVRAASCRVARPMSAIATTIGSWVDGRAARSRCGRRARAAPVR